MPGNPERYGIQPISPVPFIDKIIVYVEPRAPETSIAPGNPFDQMRYFGGLMFCQPTAAQPLLLAGTSQMMRPSTLRRCAREAGFREVDWCRRKLTVAPGEGTTSTSARS